jgi:hypothetical protein
LLWVILWVGTAHKPVITAHVLLHTDSKKRLSELSLFPESLALLML